MGIDPSYGGIYKKHKTLKTIVQKRFAKQFNARLRSRTGSLIYGLVRSGNKINVKSTAKSILHVALLHQTRRKQLYMIQKETKPILALGLRRFIKKSKPTKKQVKSAIKRFLSKKKHTILKKKIRKKSKKKLSLG